MHPRSGLYDHSCFTDEKTEVRDVLMLGVEGTWPEKGEPGFAPEGVILSVRAHTHDIVVLSSTVFLQPKASEIVCSRGGKSI